MKIRNGFVSNSSSSSFVVLLPDNFDINSVDIEKHLEDESTIDSIKKSFNHLIKDKSLYAEEVSYYSDYYILIDILKDYTIAEIETGPDSGEIVLADINKIKKIIE